MAQQQDQDAHGQEGQQGILGLGARSKAQGPGEQVQATRVGVEQGDAAFSAGVAGQVAAIAQHEPQEQGPAQ